MLPDLYLDHLVFRVHDLAETQLFWDALLGEPASKSAESLMYIVSATRLFSLRRPAKTRSSTTKNASG